MPALPAINNLRTALSLPMSGVDTVATVPFTTGFPNAGVFSVEDEAIAYTGRTPTTFTGLTRGYDGTAAVSHSAGLICSLRIIAKHLNDAAFINPLPTTAAVGGIPAGTTFPARVTVQEVLDQLLYPYQYPTFGQFGLTGASSPLEVGDEIPASITFTWTTTNSGNINPSSISILDVTDVVTLATGLADDSSEPITMGGPIQKLISTTHQFRIEGVDTLSNVFSSNLTFTWFWKLYYGTNASPTLSAGQIAALVGGILTDSYVRTYAMAAGGYKFICQADMPGDQLNSVKDLATGFNIPLATVTDDAAYSNVDGGGFSYALVSFLNDQGVTTDYRVYRTKNVLGGAISMVVT